MPAPQFAVTFSSQVDALRAQDAERSAREERMRNALEVLARPRSLHLHTVLTLDTFVRATACEGLGRDAAA